MGYYIYRGEIREHLPKIVSHSLPPETRSYIDKGYGKRGFKAGGRYFIGVSTVDSSRNESEVVIHDVQIPDLEPPLPPNFVSVKNLKNGWVEVSYGVSLSLDLSHYVIYRVENGKQTKLIELKDKKPWVDSNAIIGKEYRYGVSSVDTIGNEGELLLSEPIIAKDAIPPVSPTEVIAVLKDKGVELQWKPSDALDLLGYNVYRADLPNGSYKRLNKDVVKETSFFDPEGKGFQWYRVKAVDISENESLNRDKIQPKRKR
jgi:fibronectin type 3 domain-containing protein